MLHDALELSAGGPVVIRYPKGAAVQVPDHEVGTGKRGRRVRAGDGRVCFLAVGKLLQAAERAADLLATEGIESTVWDVRCVAPLDPDLVADAARHSVVVTAEDGIRDGGAGDLLRDAIEAAAAPGSPVRVEVLGVPVRFIPQSKPDRILADLGLDAEGLAARARAALATGPTIVA